jgi:hypothetical protein
VGKSIQLADNESRAMNATHPQCLRQFGTVRVILAALDFGKGRDDLPIAAIEPIVNDLLLGF